MRILAATTVMAVLLGACSQAPAPSHEVDFDKRDPNFSFDVFGGTLLGYNAGEWGGKLSFRNSKGITRDVIQDNVYSIIATGDGIVVFTGLSHLNVNRGHIYLLLPDNKKAFDVVSLYELDGAPDAIEFLPNGIEFRIFSGQYDLRSDPGVEIYACKLLTPDYRLLTTTDCMQPQP